MVLTLTFEGYRFFSAMIKNLRQKDPQTIPELLSEQPRPLDYVLKVAVHEYERDLDKYSTVSYLQ